MPDIGMGQAPRTLSRRARESLADLGGPAFEEVMRHDAAARLLVLARRHLKTGPRAGADAALVRATLAAWDAEAVTAAEFAETLDVAELDAFLAAARRWALAAASDPALRLAA
jgi:hypothetical protein